MARVPQRSAAERKRRQRRRRVVSFVVYVLLALGLAWFFEQQATTTILFVRHADTAPITDTNRNPPLNARGRARAELLADFLEDIDVVASVDVIYASEFLSTQQTAKPLANRLGLRVNLADPYDTVPFMKQVLGDHKGRIILVVTHADTISPLIRELHGSKNVPEIAPDEYDNLYIVTIPWFGKVKTLRLRYGIGWKPPGDLDSYTLR
jgi:broad specificity phosphatase PhoE